MQICLWIAFSTRYLVLQLKFGLWVGRNTTKNVQISVQNSPKKGVFSSLSSNFTFSEFWLILAFLTKQKILEKVHENQAFSNWNSKRISNQCLFNVKSKISRGRIRGKQPIGFCSMFEIIALLLIFLFDLFCVDLPLLLLSSMYVLFALLLNMQLE